MYLSLNMSYKYTRRFLGQTNIYINFYLTMLMVTALEAADVIISVPWIILLCCHKSVLYMYTCISKQIILILIMISKAVLHLHNSPIQVITDCGISPWRYKICPCMYNGVLINIFKYTGAIHLNKWSS